MDCYVVKKFKVYPSPRSPDYHQPRYGGGEDEGNILGPLPFFITRCVERGKEEIRLKSSMIILTKTNLFNNQSSHLFPP